MKELYLGIFLLFFLLSPSTISVFSLSSSDVAVMQSLKASLGNPERLNWTHSDPCEWSHIMCSNNRVTQIHINNQNLTGSRPPDLKNLSLLAVLHVTGNFPSGPIPSLARLSSLQYVYLSNNQFTSIPADFFSGLTSLKSITLGFNPFRSWQIPASLKDATELQTFSANLANISGSIPDFLGGDDFPRLRNLQLTGNNLEGPIPSSFRASSIQKLWLTGQTSDAKLNGSLQLLQNMTSLIQLRLDFNHFTGPLPDFAWFTSLEELSLRRHELTGTVPPSLANLPNITFVSLGNNFFQGPSPKFNTSRVEVDMPPGSTNSFCLDDPGVACDSRINILLSIVESMGYPQVFAKRWNGNDPCDASQPWRGIFCNEVGNITVVNFKDFELQGTISSDFSMLTSIAHLILSNNALTGTIPNELTFLPNLKMLDVSNNYLSGEVPKFRQTVIVKSDGNPNIVRNNSYPGATPDNNSGQNQRKGTGKRSNTGIVLVSLLIGAAFGLLIVGLGFYLYKRKQKRSPRIHRPKIVSKKFQDAMTRDIQLLGVGNIFFSVKVLREVTNDFREQNILGRGGFGTVYRGEFQDGTKIAVKRMEAEIVSERRLKQFKSEIAVLTKVRHRHLVALLGYCLDGEERLLVYEFTSQGTLSRHLFNWKNEGLKPLEWSRRLIIALDVARGVEYLHGLAHESFIHRDLKPSNILLDHYMRAKVADFGLVRLAPKNGKHSTETRIAGTFGYLAPVTGRVTTKVDVFSFGVILMELITGRKVIGESDDSDPENIVYIVTWFRTVHIDQDAFRMAVDETIELDTGTLASVRNVAELAEQCCESEPYKRPDMARIVNVLSSLAEL